MEFSPMSVTPYESAKKSVEALAPADQLRLVSELMSRLSTETGKRPRSLLELEGLGQDVWEGLDVADYLRRERSSWNG
jgi:hypothetical protein